MIIGKLGRNLSRNLAGSWRYIRAPLEFRKIIWTNTIIFRFYISLRGCIVHQIHVKYMLCFFQLGNYWPKIDRKNFFETKTTRSILCKVAQGFFRYIHVRFRMMFLYKKCWVQCSVCLWCLSPFSPRKNLYTIHKPECEGRVGCYNLPHFFLLGLRLEDHPS